MKLEPGVYWLTRDSDPCTGELMDECEIWTAMPTRRECSLTELGIPRSYYWMFGEWDLRPRLGKYRLSVVHAYIGTVPDNDRELIRVEIGGPKK